MNQQTPWFIIILIVFTLSLNARQYQHYTNSHDALYDEMFSEFCKPIRFTHSDLKHFLQNIYSHRRYAQDYLPHNFSHFIQFMHEGKEHNQTMVYAESTIRLFTNKLKSSRYVSAYAFSDMLGCLPDLLKSYCLTCQNNTSYFEQARSVIKDVLYSFFLSKFSFFKSNPDTFFDDLSLEMITSLNDNQGLRSNVEKEELRQTLIRFLEIGLMKLIWSPNDQELIWDSVKKTADQLTDLYNAQIINQDELDDLFKSLLESFCRFLDLAGSELSLDIIDSIKEDVSSGSLLLFSLAEQEDFIETKAERMISSIIETEAKVRARHQGIITDPVVCP